ncbi:MAG: hypothetical protein H3C57_05120 [Gammaproteobacteria bacterium]|nr:hypothetical protein [Gammaproteobacteria bacterium]
MNAGSPPGLQPERLLRLLDQLDCLGGALRLLWAGCRQRWMRRLLLVSGCVLAAAATGLPLP